MSYLERNESILKEVARQLGGGAIPRGQLVGSSDKTDFRSVGLFWSDTLGKQVSIGLKEGVGRDFSRLFGYRAEMELVRIAVIDRYLPHLGPLLPDFYGLVDRPGDYPAAITEDYSRGGLIEVDNMMLDSKLLPFELSTLDPTQDMTRYELAKMCFMVEGRVRLGDFDGFLSTLRNTKDVLERFPFGYSLDEFKQYLQRNRLQFTGNL